VLTSHKMKRVTWTISTMLIIVLISFMGVTQPSVLVGTSNPVRVCSSGSSTCTFDCTSGYPCAHITLDCGTFADCRVSCSGSYSCEKLQINAQNAGMLAVTTSCDGDAPCQCNLLFAVVNCPERGSCSILNIVDDTHTPTYAFDNAIINGQSATSLSIIVAGWTAMWSTHVICPQAGACNIQVLGTPYLALGEAVIAYDDIAQTTSKTSLIVQAGPSYYGIKPTQGARITCPNICSLLPHEAWTVDPMDSDSKPDLGHVTAFTGTDDPTRDPTSDPTRDPTRDPSSYPTRDPTRDPTMESTSGDKGAIRPQSRYTYN